MEWHDFIPVPASSSCGRRHEETRQWRPTACCVPEIAGCLCMGPDKKKNVTHTTSDWMESNSDLLHEFYLNVFSESVKYLFCHCHGLGEVLFPWFINDILPRVIPIEITDRLLDLKEMGKVIIKSLLWMYHMYHCSVHIDLRCKVNGCVLVTAHSPAYLQSEEIIHCTDDDVDGGGAANLSPQVVLKIYSTASF